MDSRTGSGFGKIADCHQATAWQLHMRQHSAIGAGRVVVHHVAADRCAALDNRDTVVVRGNRHVVGDADIDGAFGGVAIGVGGDHLDRTEIGEVIAAAAVVIVVVQRHRHAGRAALAHQRQRHHCRPAAVAADDLGVGHTRPCQAAIEAGRVAKRHRGDRIRAGREDNRVGNGRLAGRRAVGKFLVVNGQRDGATIRNRRAIAISDRDRLGRAVGVAITVGDDIGKARAYAIGVVQARNRRERPCAVRLERVGAVRRLDGRRALGRDRVLFTADGHRRHLGAVGAGRVVGHHIAADLSATLDNRDGLVVDGQRNVVNDLDRDAGRRR